MNPENTIVGWIGVGHMGLPMCKNLLRGGIKVIVYDDRDPRTALAIEAGAAVAPTVASLASVADVIFSMPYDDNRFRTLVSGPEGLMAGIRPGTLYIDMSTVSPEVSAAMALLLEQKKVRYLRAPVSGSTGLAEAGTLSVIASGTREDFDECLPLMRLMSQVQNYVGEGEAARVLKLLINMMVINATALLGEALTLGEKEGLPRDVMVDAINNSIVGSRHYLARSESLKTRRYTSAGPIKLVTKDMDMALSMAGEHNLSLPVTTLVRGYMAELLREGKGEVEVSILAEFPRQTKESRQ